MLKPKAQKELQKGFLSATYNTKSKFSISKIFEERKNIVLFVLLQLVILVKLMFVIYNFVFS